jgi:hypothetical protein
MALNVSITVAHGDGIGPKITNGAAGCKLSQGQ